MTLHLSCEFDFAIQRKLLLDYDDWRAAVKKLFGSHVHDS